ncbi:unnamed protein product, partial [Linum tenue]
MNQNLFLGLREFLGRVTQSQPHLELVLNLNKLHNLQQVTSFDSDPPLVVERLELGTVVPKTFDVKKGGGALLDGLFRVCHPTFLLVTRRNNEPLFFVSTFIIYAQ